MFTQRLPKRSPPSFLSRDFLYFSSETSEGKEGGESEGERDRGGNRAVATNRHAYLLNTFTFPLTNLHSANQTDQ